MRLNSHRIPTRLFSSERSRVSGFTLIELMVVVAIMGILMAVGLVAYGKVSESARNSKRKADLEQVRSALVLYKVDSTTSRYPSASDWDSMMALVQSYISTPSINDPKPSPYAQYTYSYTAATNTFSICATLENVTPANYCLSNP
jgi:general secretion pathway protein G